MKVSFRQLRHLVVLSEEAHFGRAAERLGLSQPALSRSIKSIEDSYGVDLIVRGSDGAVPTRTGEEALRLARGILQNAAHLDEFIRDEADGKAGSVFAGIAPLAASVALSTICARVLASRPGIRLYTDVQPNFSLSDQLTNATYDFLLCPPLGLPALHDFDIQPVGSIPFDLIVRAGHPLAGVKLLTMEDIRSFPIIGAHTSPAGRQAEFAPGTSFFGLGPLSLSCDNYDVLARVTEDSDSVWLASRLAAKEQIASGQLIIVPNTDIGFPNIVELAIVTLKSVSLSPATLEVMNDVQSVMTQLSW
ncbi:MAG: LysR family transcriptional regulator [Hyphomonas sp.]|uniref:LysR family transcriptional regulator n=1 Tax=Hyphomonas sp. TaxID=87 RepID=UPI003002B32A